MTVQHRSLKRLFAENKRQMAVMSAVLFIAFAALFTGIFSYFHSTDTVSNRLSSRNGSVALREPEWKSTGKAMAAASEPGMKIPKDPRGVNTGQTDLFIRLKMTVELGAYSGNLTGTDTEDGEVGIPTSGKRLKALIDAIKLNSDGDKFLNLTIAEGDGNNASEWKATSLNSSFTADEKNYGTDDTLVFYFYYTGGDKDSENNPVMKAVPPDGSTAVLFREMDIPIYKKDYLGVFDQKYTITMEAEGIPSADYTGGLKVSDAPEKFAEQ